MSSWGQLARQALGVRLGRLHQHAPAALSVRAAPLAQPGADPLPFALVTPSFNQARFIGATLDSVRAQRYPALHFVVQDACSNDGTDVVLRDRGSGFDVHIEADAGQADAINRGFARTTAPLMGWLNSDDMLLPGTLAFVASYFAEHPEADVVYGNRIVVDAQGREVGRWILPGHDERVLRFVDYVPQECLFWRRRAWTRVGARLDDRLHFALDWDLLLRFVDAGCVIHHVPELFGVFRVHQDQKTQSQFALRGAGEMEALRRAQGSRLPSRARRLALHAAFLWRHRRADARFTESLRASGVRGPGPAGAGAAR